MPTYTLNVTLDGEQDATTFECYDDPTIPAIGVIMDKAYESELWADGAIELVAPDGEVLRTMEAKR